MGGSSGAVLAGVSVSSPYQVLLNCWYCSILPTAPISFMLARLSARPDSPARPVRPTRCTCTSGSGVMSTLITASN